MEDQSIQPEKQIADETPREVLQEVIVEEEQTFAIRFLFLVGALLVVLVLLLYTLPSTAKLRLAQHVPTDTEEISEPPRTDAYAILNGVFPEVPLEADAAYVLDLQTGQALFSKNGDAQLPLASLTKLMTVLVAADLFGNTGEVAITPESLQVEGSTGLAPEDSWLSRDLFTFTLMQSSNGGARAIAAAAGGSLPIATRAEYEDAEKRFVENMNERAKELGLLQTYFINETGLDETAQTGGGYGSARDVAYLMGEMVKQHPDLLEGTSVDALALSTLENESRIAINTNQDIGSIPALIGSKTGYTELAGGNLVIAFDRGIGRPVIIAVLGSSKEGRFSDVRMLVKATFDYLENTR